MRYSQRPKSNFESNVKDQPVKAKNELVLPEEKLAQKQAYFQRIY